MHAFIKIKTDKSKREPFIDSFLHKWVHIIVHWMMPFVYNYISRKYKSSTIFLNACIKHFLQMVLKETSKH